MIAATVSLAFAIVFFGLAVYLLAQDGLSKKEAFVIVFMLAAGAAWFYVGLTVVP